MRLHACPSHAQSFTAVARPLKGDNTTMSNIQEFMCAAGRGYPELRFGDEVEIPRADLTPFEQHIEAIENRLDTEAFISETNVREETRQKLTAELLDAERKGWAL